MVPESWEPSLPVEKIPIWGSLGKIKFVLGILRIFFQFSKCFRLKNIRILIIDIYKIWLNFYCTEQIQNSIKTKSRVAFCISWKKPEQLWVEHDCQSVLEKAKHIEAMPKAGVSLREEGRSHLHPSHRQWTLRLLLTKAWAESFPSLLAPPFGVQLFGGSFAPEAVTRVLLPNTHTRMRVALWADWEPLHSKRHFAFLDRSYCTFTLRTKNASSDQR